MSRTIRFAESRDVPDILRLIRGLAEYEKLVHELNTDESALREHLFGDSPACEALVLEAAVDAAGVRTVGFALFFTAFSTFETSPFLYLEDLFVEPAARGRGHGQALLRELVSIAQVRGWPRVQWSVLDWNEPAIGFYRRFGAEVLPDWRTCRFHVPAE